jgi:hypothetical protein
MLEGPEPAGSTVEQHSLGASLSPDDVFRAPWSWRSISRPEACLSWRTVPVVMVLAPRQARRPRALWFSTDDPAQQRATAYELDGARYFRYEGQLGDARAPSTGAAAPVAAPPPAPAQAPEPKKEKLCELVAVDVKCGHGRQPHKQKRLLEVVPPPGGDKISLSAKLKGGCGEHPRWEISGPTRLTRTGTEATFPAESWTVKSLLLFEVVPKPYDIHAHGCQGLMQSTRVLAYPCDKVEIAIDLKKGFSIEVKMSPDEGHARTIKLDLTKKVTDSKQAMDYVLEKILKPWVEPLEFEVFKVKGKFAGGWEEWQDHRAFYKYSATLELDPLVKGTFTVPFGPTAAIPPWIKKWTTDLIGDFYLYLKFEGEVGLAGGWAKESPDKGHGTVSGKGKVGVKAGGSLFLMNKKALNLDVCGATDITLEAKNVPEEKHPTVEYDLKWGGLKIELTVEAMWGMVEYKHEWTVMKERSFFDKPKRWTPFK